MVNCHFYTNRKSTGPENSGRELLLLFYCLWCAVPQRPKMMSNTKKKTGISENFSEKLSYNSYFSYKGQNKNPGVQFFNMHSWPEAIFLNSQAQESKSGRLRGQLTMDAAFTKVFTLLNLKLTEESAFIGQCPRLPAGGRGLQHTQKLSLSPGMVGLSSQHPPHPIPPPD